jgi:hypothetical protein
VVLYGFISSTGIQMYSSGTGIQGYSSSTGLQGCMCNTEVQGIGVVQVLNGYRRCAGVQSCRSSRVVGAEVQV